MPSSSAASASAPLSSDCILEVSDLSKQFGGVRALSNYNLSLRRGELLGLIGPNGAGKTTAFNLLTGVLKPTSGSIVFEGKALTGRPAHHFATAGISRTFQNIRLFRDLTVLDNVKAGLHMRHGTGVVATVLGLPTWRRSERTITQRAMELLALTGLDDIALVVAGDLSYGDQRRVEIARALASEPRLLLLDEPAAGMNPQETETLTGMIRHIHRQFDLTLVVVEHDIRLVMSLSDRVQVINRGEMLAIGTPEVIQRDPHVVEAYLGTGRKSRKRRGRRGAEGKEARHAGA